MQGMIHDAGCMMQVKNVSQNPHIVTTKRTKKETRRTRRGEMGSGLNIEQMRGIVLERTIEY